MAVKLAPPTKWRPPLSPPPPPPPLPTPPLPPALPGRTVPRVGVTPGIGGLVTPPGPTYVPPVAPPAVPKLGPPGVGLPPPVPGAEPGEEPPPVIAPMEITSVSPESVAALLATLGLPLELEKQALESFQESAATFGWIDDIREIDLAQARKEGWLPKRETQKVTFWLSVPEERWVPTEWDPISRVPTKGEVITDKKWQSFEVPLTGYFREPLASIPWGESEEYLRLQMAQKEQLATQEQETAQQQQRMQMLITLLGIWPRLNPAQRAAMSDWLGRMGIDLEGLLGAMGQMGGAPSLQRGTPSWAPARMGR